MIWDLLLFWGVVTVAYVMRWWQKNMEDGQYDDFLD